VTVGLVYRITVEERALLQTLGDRYRKFAATRKGWFPSFGSHRNHPPLGCCS